jgi:transposase
MMPAPYPLELRRRIVRAYNNKEGSVRALAREFAVAPGTVQHYLNLFRETGDPAPRPHRGGVAPRIDPRRMQVLRCLLHEMPDATLAELAEVLAQQCHVEVSRQTLARALQRARCEGGRSGA